jgi:hypothetical protein
MQRQIQMQVLGCAASLRMTLFIGWEKRMGYPVFGGDMSEMRGFLATLGMTLWLLCACGCMPCMRVCRAAQAERGAAVGGLVAEEDCGSGEGGAG